MQENRKYEFKEIEYFELKLNLSSPRLPKSKQEKDETTVIEFMLLESATLELMMAIGQNDFFIGEPLLIIEDDREQNKYIVIEGNRRLTAVKLLSTPELANVKKESIKQIVQEAVHKPKKIPCLIFKDKKEVLRQLGFKHITGIKSWRLLEKARYLYNLKQTEFATTPLKKASRELAKIIGTRSNYVQRLIVSYDIFTKIEEKNFYKISNLDDTTFYLNYVLSSLNQAKVSEFLGVDFNNKNPLENLKFNHLKKWTHWLFEKKLENKTRLIGDNHDLSMLNKILESPEAFKAFDKEELSLNQAYKLAVSSFELTN